jgi:pyruvate kinase
MIDAGLDVARLNFSHGTIEDHQHAVDLIRDAAEAAGRPVAVLGDLPGPKLRVSKLENDLIELQSGRELTISTEIEEGKLGNARHLFVEAPQLAEAVSAGEVIYLADGKLRLRVTAVRPEQGELDASVEVGGMLASRQGLNVPGEAAALPAVGHDDIELLRAGERMRIDMVALSFVRSADDVNMVRSETRLPLISKIEKPQAVERQDEIIAASDIIMVARGDLGIELPIEQMPVVQKRLLRACGRLARPSITATQMLDSMVTSSRPTRAEATDVANAILDGTDAVMLSQETAVGAYPVESIAMLDAIARATEPEAPYREWTANRVTRAKVGPDYTVAHAACEAVRSLGLDALIVPTLSGRTARIVSAHRPTVPILALSPGKETVRRCGMFWGVKAASIDRHATTEGLIADATRRVIELGWCQPGMRVGVTAGLPSAKPGSTSLLQVMTLGAAGAPWQDWG